MQCLQPNLHPTNMLGLRPLELLSERSCRRAVLTQRAIEPSTHRAITMSGSAVITTIQPPHITIARGKELHHEQYRPFA